MALPFCRCGCGRRVKVGRHRWATPQCVPRSLRAETMRRNAIAHGYRVRRQKFAAIWRRIAADRSVVTRGMVFAAMAEAYAMARSAERAAQYRDRQLKKTA